MKTTKDISPDQHLPLELFAMAVEQSSESIVITDAEINPPGPHILYVNSAFSRITGYCREEVLGRNPRFLQGPHSDRHVLNQVRQCLERGLPFTGETCNYRKDGTEFHMEWSITPLRNARGDITHFISVQRNVTTQREAEQALRESREHHRLLSQTAPVLIWTSGPDKKCTSFNEGWLFFTGRTQEQELGDGWTEGVHPDDLEHCLKTYTEAFDRRERFTMEYRLRRHDGEYRWLVDTGVPRFGPEGAFEGYTGSCIDINDRKELEELLREMELVAGIGGWMVDPRSGKVLWTPETYKVCDLPSGADVDLEKMLSFFPGEPGERLRSGMKDLKERGTPIDQDFPMVSATGRRLWVHVRGRATLVEGRVVRIFGAVQDITERVEMEKRFNRSQRLEAVGTLSSGIAHDLNNALAPITMALGLLRDSQPENREILLNLELSVRRATDMVQHLLSFTKGTEIARAPVRPESLVREMGQIVMHTFPKNIRLITRVGENLPCISGDSTQLHQVLLNLCLNARDAMPGGGILTLSASLENCPPDGDPAAPPSPHVVFRVRDTGEGISPEILDRILIPFFTTKGPEKGSGLGLTTSVGILKGHGGHLRMWSELGAGSEFAACLPAGTRTAHAGEEVPPAKPLRGSSELVLVVEDEPLVRDMMESCLHKLNYRTAAARNGKEGLEKAATLAGRLDAVITDYHMPDMDGLAFIRELRSFQPGLPVIVSSGYLENHIRNAMNGLGVTRRLDKPFTEEMLAEVLFESLHPS